MELSAKEFLDSVVNPNTRKGYRVGIKKFCEWFGNSPREILEARKDYLTQRPREDLIEYRNRAALWTKIRNQTQMFFKAQRERACPTRFCYKGFLLS